MPPVGTQAVSSLLMMLTAAYKVRGNEVSGQRFNQNNTGTVRINA